VIEIALGTILVLVVAGALSAGAAGLLLGASGFDPVILVGYGGMAVLLAVGLVLVLSGALRRAIHREPANRHALRSARLALRVSLAVAALAAGPAMIAELLNLLRITALPAGTYAAAEGALIGLVVVAFAWTARQSRIDREERIGE
jgi:putative solute:sodium symporter small subunit